MLNEDDNVYVIITVVVKHTLMCVLQNQINFNANYCIWLR